MKKILIVLQYELREYFNNKGFMLFTFLLAFASAALLFLPRFVDMSKFTGVGKNGETAVEIVKEEKEKSEKKELLVYDEIGYVDFILLNSLSEDVSWAVAESTEEIKKAVENEEAEAGFVVKSALEYDYYVYNKGLSDSNNMIFDEAMKIFYRMKYCEENNLNYDEITEMYEVEMNMNEQVLNIDKGMNYWYCYTLVIIVFMLIMMYGQMIAVSVTQEKSNRAIEILVTTTTPNSLLFGKVFAGAIGGLFQSGFIMGAILTSYQLNRRYWGGMLDIIFQIPAEVLIAFAFFGIGGYLFYAFLYGAMGALVSKTEDVSKSAGGLMVVIMIVYFFSLIQLNNADGIIIKILSFLPISSYSTMFARIAIGTVAPWEIIVSFIILAASILAAGMLGAALYRMGTLRYGNPIKLSTALKDLLNAKKEK